MKELSFVNSLKPYVDRRKHYFWGNDITFFNTRRKEDDVPLVVPVYGNLSKPPSTRSVPTNRGIYLPESNFGTVNDAYLEVAETSRKEDMFTTVSAHIYEEIGPGIKFGLRDAEIPRKEDMFTTMSAHAYHYIEPEIRFDLRDAEIPRKEDMFNTLSTHVYQNIEPEIRLNGGFPKHSSRDENGLNPLPSPSPHATEDYYEIIPNEDSTHPSTEAIASGASLSRVFENKLVTSL